MINRLNAGASHKLILVSAPAGFGKTTLIVNWLQEIEQRAAWFSLDEGDNVLSRFLTYFIAALSQVDEKINVDVFAAVQANEDPQIEPLLTELVNQIAALDNEFTVILDDYHTISNPIIFESLTFLVEHLPPNMHLVMIGRADPPFSVSRLRAGGQMTELRSNDLRFSENEIEQYLNEVKGISLSPADIKMLETRTEGWIASLQLAALSLQGRDNKAQFIEAFSGSHQYVLDYLVDEVMDRQTEEIQSFLCQSSIFERFQAPLADAALGISKSKEIIQFLAEANLFLIPLDDDRNWFRYHHLFADFLRQRLREQEADTIPKLHQRASFWLEENNLFPEAIHHALVGEDYIHAATLLEKIGPQMMMQSEFEQLTDWLDSMPENLVHSWPWLCIIRAWMFQRWALLDEAERYLTLADRTLEMDTTPEPAGGIAMIQGQIAAIRALNALSKMKLIETAELAKQALHFLPEGTFNRGVAGLALGFTKRIKGDFDGAAEDFRKALHSSLAAGNRILAQAVMNYIGILQAQQGQLHLAADTFREASQLKYQNRNLFIPYASTANIFLAEILREWNDLQGALMHLENGLEIGKPAQVVDAVAAGYATYSRVYHAQDNLTAAKEALLIAEKMMDDIPDLEHATKVAVLAAKVELLLSQNKFAQAASVLSDEGVLLTNEITDLSQIEEIMLAQVHIRAAHQDQANLNADINGVLELLEGILNILQPYGCLRESIQILVLQALAYKKLGMQDSALDAISTALTLAEPEGYVRTFIDEGAPIVELLRLAASKGVAENYAKSLIAAFEGKSPLPTPQGLIEPLSNRELEVLRMLTTDNTGPEIANHLMVSLNTLRTHTKNIYAKLGVNKRRSAVSKAKEINLI